MKRTFTFQVQFVLSLLVGMMLSFITIRVFPSTLIPATLTPPPIATATLMPVVTSTLSVIPTPTSMETPKPYVTISGVWLVRIQFSSTNAPQVLKVTRLQKGRITPFSQGDYQVELLDESGGILFSGAFVVSFLQGDPPRSVDQIIDLLILPIIDKAVELRIKTPQGETIYDLEP